MSDKDKNMLAIHCTSDQLSGLENNALKIMEWLNDAGANLTYFGPAGFSAVKVAKEKNIPTVPLPVYVEQSTFKRAHILSRYLKKGEYKVLMLLKPRDLAAAAIIKKIFYRSIKLVYYQHIEHNKQMKPWIFSLIFRSFDSIFELRNYLLEQTLTIPRINSNKLHIIPTGIDSEKITKKLITKEQARKALSLPAKKRIVGIVGKHSHKRKHHFLIRAIQFLRRNNYDVDLLIMGDSHKKHEKEYYAFLKELTHECNVEKYVHFRPCDEDLSNFFCSIDAFVHNISGSPYDTICLQAMISGTPVIAVSSDNNKELLEEGKYGLLYKANDLEDFAAKTIRLITQPKIEEHLINEGKKVVQTTYDKPVIVSKIIDLTNKLIHSES
ncbi:MAG: glycosyltransferase family 4 protein [Bacteroidales bacterium]|nr:glycosyltransferase family 4 protein [Bacteroidales bacterium]